MTNFIYNMQDELFHLPLEDFSTIKKLVDHIEAQGKQLRELNAAITKRNTTIEKYEHKNKDLRERNALLVKKVDELNEGIRNSEDLTWKQKYDALLQSSEQAIGALQKKCQEYKNADTIDALAKAARCPWGDNAEIISAKIARIKKLEEDKKAIEKRCREAEKALEHAKHVSKDLNVIINSKNKLLDEYMTKCNNLEHNYNEEVRMKEQFKSICFRHEKTIKKLKKELDFWKASDTFSTASYLTKRCNKAEEENKKLKEDKKVIENNFAYEMQVSKDLKRDNDILRGKVNEISDLAESIVMLCDDEE